MKIIKKINTSAALALDSAGREVVVLGKGIGFPPVPYELEDLSKVERTFYDVNPKYFGMMEELPQPILLASADIAEQAEMELNCQLNANLPFTLADHLHFAHERLEKGINLTMPIAYDVRHMYPKEYELGVQALKTLEELTGIVLPEHEAVSVAMHLINAESEGGDMHSLAKALEIIEEVDKIVEKSLHITLDRDDYHYSRFAMHLRHLIRRLEFGGQTGEDLGAMSNTMKREYPDIYVCALQVTEYFRKTCGWECKDDELLYLMIHIHRVANREAAG